MNSEFTIAVHSLVYLAHIPDHMASSERIAGNVCTHPARIRKVMSRLREGGFVDTKEGVGGGYFLKVAAEDIRVGEVYRLTATGAIKPSWCSGDVSQSCVVASNIAEMMDELFAGAEQRVIEYFEAFTIQDLLRRMRGRVEHGGDR